MSSFDYKHTFEYEVANSTHSDVPNQKITFTTPGDASLNNMLTLFDQYLRACGFHPPENCVLDYAQVDGFTSGEQASSK